MADEDKTIVENGSGNEEEQAPKKKGNKLILFGGIGVGAVAIGIVLALFVIKPMMSDAPAGGDESAQVEENSHDKKEDSHGSKKKKKDGHGEASEAMIYAINDIVVNPAGTGGSRFLSISFGFELEDALLHAEFENKEIIIRDALITILSSKTVSELTDPKQKEIVRYQIKKRISHIMDSDEIAGVYYTDFVLQ